MTTVDPCGRTGNDSHVEQIKPGVMLIHCVLSNLVGMLAVVIFPFGWPEPGRL